MNERYYLKIKWKDYEKTELYDIILFDEGFPLSRFKSLEDARLVKNVLNEQDEMIKEQSEIIRELLPKMMVHV